jgi:pimeloyl-ACP methyl ester carboxylesterase
MNTANDMGSAAGKRRGCLGCLGRAAIGLAAFLVIVLAAGAIYQAAASASDLKRYPPPGELYDVGGYRLHLYCTGEGSPTVILEAGSASSALSWHLVQKGVAGFTRVCSYDRAGFGWSDPASGPLLPGQVAEDLHKLLTAADVPGPSILVGHSAGGFYIRAYAGQYASEVVGMVLVDAVHEGQEARYPAEYVRMRNSARAMMPLCSITSPIGFVRALRLSDFSGVTVPAEVREAYLSTVYRNAFCPAMVNEEKAVSTFLSQPDIPRSLGDLPLTVLSAGAAYDRASEAEVAAMGGPEVVAQIAQIHDEFQEKLAGLSTQGKLIIAAESGHLIPIDQPDLVIDAIREMVERARGS